MGGNAVSGILVRAKQNRAFNNRTARHENHIKSKILHSENLKFWNGDWNFEKRCLIPHARGPVAHANGLALSLSTLFLKSSFSGPDVSVYVWFGDFLRRNFWKHRPVNSPQPWVAWHCLPALHTEDFPIFQFNRSFKIPNFASSWKADSYQGFASHTNQLVDQ